MTKKTELKIMINYTINIDRIQLTFNNTDLKLKDKNNFTIHFLPPSKYSFSYLCNILIKYKDIDFLYLSHRLKINESISVIKLLNNPLYTLDFTSILINFLTTFNITDYKITDLEVSINTNTPLTTKYYKNYKKNKIIFDNDYSYNDTFDFGQTKQLLTKDFDNRTFYIYKKNVKKELRLLELRIENKTNEITDKNHKQYILDYYKLKGLDTTKNIYRMELTINLSKLRKTCFATKYKNIYDFTSSFITPKTFKTLNCDKTDYKLFRFYKKYEIDLNLLNDEVYLIKLFNTFVMINYSILIQNDIKDKLSFEMTPRMIKTEQVVIQDEYKKEFNNIIDMFS